MTNFTTGRLSWAPEPNNAQFDQIKGLIIFFVASLIIMGIIIRKLLILYAEKIPKTEDPEIMSKINKLSEPMDKISFSSKPKPSSIKAKYTTQLSFDPRVCTACDSDSVCVHDVVDGGRPDLQNLR